MVPNGMVSLVDDNYTPLYANHFMRQFLLFQTLPIYLTIILRGNFCALPGVQGAGPADAARRCGRSDVLVAGVLRREGQPGRGVVLSGLVLVSKIKSDLA